ncbi:hypothetical protein DMUE_2215 [Dictyocoela muelleri]|nr:hypothetical protein DMUE_2215 [Dictyocoela muelleri]
MNKYNEPQMNEKNKKFKCKNESYCGPTNGINTFFLELEESDCRVKIYFNNKIYPDEIKLMRGKPGAENDELFTDSDLLESAEIDSEHKTISVLLNGEKLAKGQSYSIKISENNKPYYTEKFLQNPDTGEFLTEREYEENKTFKFPENRTIFIVVMSIIILICIILILFFVCR